MKIEDKSYLYLKKEEFKEHLQHFIQRILSRSKVKFQEHLQDFTEFLFLGFIVIFQALDLLSMYFRKYLVDQKYP